MVGFVCTKAQFVRQLSAESNILRTACSADELSLCCRSSQNTCYLRSPMYQSIIANNVEATCWSSTRLNVSSRWICLSFKLVRTEGRPCFVCAPSQCSIPSSPSVTNNLLCKSTQFWSWLSHISCQGTLDVTDLWHRIHWKVEQFPISYWYLASKGWISWCLRNCNLIQISVAH
jgi:hypothetical protein